MRSGLKTSCWVKGRDHAVESTDSFVKERLDKLEETTFMREM